MTTTSKQAHYISPEQLRIGLYIHLDLGWMDHPFTFNNFKIKDEVQISQIRKLGLARLRYDPLRSDVAPEPLPAVEEPVDTQASEPVTQAPVTEHSEKQTQQQRRLRELHQAVLECEKKFALATQAATKIERDIQLNPARSMQQAQTLVADMVDSLLTEGEVVLHAIQPRPGLPEQYVHSLNVTVLALLLCKSLDMTTDNAQHLGVGAIYHDLGKAQIPARIAKKSEALTRAEQTLMQQHCVLGAKHATTLGMHEQVIRIILQHHEHMDGTGYPNQLKQEGIDYLARIVALANIYDNLCNPLDPAQAMTPYEALSHMFAHLRSRFDPSLLKLLIKSLGIYPPGSLVQLSDGSYGIVLAINPSKPLRPHVLIHAPEIPRHTPLLIDLGAHVELSITHCLRISQLPKDAHAYLNPATRISYFFDQENKPQQ